MRALTYGGAVSLDGFLAGMDGLTRLAALQQGRAAGNGGLLEGPRHYSDGTKNLRSLGREQSKEIQRR
jgi:hypothetical protein